MTDARPTFQADHWNGPGGDVWVKHQGTLDEVVRPFGRLALDAASLAQGDHVLDVGCGCGDTTLEIGERVGPTGRVVALDVSQAMLARAKERLAARSPTASVEIVHGDAATHPIPEESFDALVSRFGVMFFEEPERAFANFARALRPGGRLAFVCWRALDENPWASMPLAALASVAPLPPPPPPHAPGPFAFADAARIRAILERAGFDDVRLDADDRAIPLGPHGTGTRRADVLEYLVEVGPCARALATLDEATRARALRALEAAVAAAAPKSNDDDESVWLDAATWVVTARQGR